MTITKQQQMLDSDEIVQYHSSKYNKDTYSIEWLDI